MRTSSLAAAFAALALAPPRPSAAQEVPARFGGYSVEAVDEGGRTLPTFEHRGRTYVLGSLGRRYLLRFRNGTARRVEVVGSVDGRDVVDGRPASLEKRGYVVPPFGELTIDGYRLSEDSVAAFRFSSVSRSYAARKGDARDVGIVGLAVFAERRAFVPPPAPYRPRGEAPQAGANGAPVGSEGRAEQTPPSAEAPSADRGAADAQARRKAMERPGLATEFGEAHESHVERTTFERASDRPAAVLTFRYDDRDGLVALGIDVDGSRRPDELSRRESALPFRADAAFCAPPPGWRAKGR